MKFRSVFDIIGPVMIGPSSSHTAGAARIGRVARNLYERMPKKVIVSFYGSFAETYKGHGTDVAIVGGLLDFDTFDERIRTSLQLAKNAGMEVIFHTEHAIPPDHPNTVRLVLSDEKSEMELVGISIGGGKIEITELNGFQLRLSGGHPTLLVVHNDRAGVIASVANVFAKHSMNIGHMEVSRQGRGKLALMCMEVDYPISDDIVTEVSALPNIVQATRISE